MKESLSTPLGPSWKRRKRDGFSLVEVSVALGVVATTMLLLLPLLASGVQTNSVSIEQTQAANLASMIIADVRGSSPTSTTAMFGLPSMDSVRGLLPTANATVTEERFISDAYESSEDLEDPGHPSKLPNRFRVNLTYRKPVALGVAPVEVNLVITLPAKLDPTVAAQQESIDGQYATFFTVPHPDAYK